MMNFFLFFYDDSLSFFHIQYPSNKRAARQQSVLISICFSLSSSYIGSVLLLMIALSRIFHFFYFSFPTFLFSLTCADKLDFSLTNLFRQHELFQVFEGVPFQEYCKFLPF
jgi:hypothetical protein